MTPRNQTYIHFFYLKIVPSRTNRNPIKLLIKTLQIFVTYVLHWIAFLKFEPIHF